MLKSSNIHIISSALLKASKIIRRDFNEIEKLQNSKIGTEKFVNSSLKSIKELLYFDLSKARPEWKIIFINDEFEANIEENLIYFVVNCVSGIKNYSKGISYFASSIAVMSKGDILTSVIYDPVKDDLFYSEKGKGAFMNNSRIRVSSNKDISKTLLVVQKKELIEKIINNKDNLEDIRILGSDCLDLANTASGKIDCLCLDDLNNIKHSAGLLLVRESGGIIYEKNDQNFHTIGNSTLIEKFK